MICPACDEEAPPDAKWCEACGQDLNADPLPACVSCGEREVAEDGYCLSCGHKQPGERDHMEFSDGPAVAVTDRGRRHRHNEDAVAIGSTQGGAAVLVVCDGVSTTEGSAEASLRAASTARDLLVAGLDGTGSPHQSEPDAAAAGRSATVIDPQVLLVQAVEAAQAEATASADDPTNGGQDPAAEATDGGGPPSSTFVAVVATPTDDGVDLATAWVGDSRAYWVGDEARLLSGEDHVLAGSLVRWLGADSIDPTPDIASTSVRGSGHLVVCSDGLWRYAGEPGELGELVGRLRSEGHDGLDLASALVDFANESGGHDNITVALWPSDPGPADGAGPRDEATAPEQGSATDQQGGQA